MHGFCSNVFLFFCGVCDLSCLVFAIRVLAGTKISSVSFSFSSTSWLFSLVSDSRKSAVQSLPSEQSASGFALNIILRSVSGIFLSSMGINKLPYESASTSNLSRARILLS